MAKILENDAIKVKGGTNGKYEIIIECSNGLRNVRNHNRWGYIDQAGREVTECKYDGPAEFKDGFATVKYDRGYVKLDTNGVEHEI